MKFATVFLSLTCAVLLLPSVASAQQCFGLSPTTGCRVNGGRPGACLGTSDADHIVGTNGDDVIVALGGDDLVVGQRGSDVICGGDGGDRLRAGSAGSTIDGGAGDDDINGGPGNDTVLGGAGDDVVDGAGGDDTLDGGDDVDNVDGGAGIDTCIGETVSRCESVVTTTSTTTTTITLPPPPTTTTTLPPPATSTSSTSTSTLATTTTVAPTTSTVAPTTSTVGPTTSTVGPTTTTTVVTGCAMLDLTMHAGHGILETATELDLGWTGVMHDADLADAARLALDITAATPGTCSGISTIDGINPVHGNCRCATDNRTICDQPFAVDEENCGVGGACICYMAPPESVSGGNIPLCLVRRISGDITGTWNVDTGSSNISVDLSQDVYLAHTQLWVCPTCGKRCLSGDNINAPCKVDSDCDATTAGGVCGGTTDSVPNDGIRGGQCVGGANDGLSCDVNSFDATFPAPQGGGYSYDCMPDPGKRISGSGLTINLPLSTEIESLTATFPCGSAGSGELCFCDPGADAPSTHQNGCESSCNDEGGGEAHCDNVDATCDGIVRADGSGLIHCLNDADCEPDSIGFDAGTCSLGRLRGCFLDPIVSDGTADPTNPIFGAITCVPKTANAVVNSAVGLPGPERVYTSATAQLLP